MDNIYGKLMVNLGKLIYLGSHCHEFLSPRLGGILHRTNIHSEHFECLENENIQIWTVKCKLCEVNNFAFNQVFCFAWIVRRLNDGCTALYEAFLFHLNRLKEMAL